MKILVAEDDVKINAFISKGLKESGFLVESVFDGGSAEDHILNDPALDLVVLDLMLPKKSGLDVITTIRNDKRDIPILVLSAKRSVHEKIEGLKIGADDYMEKPFSFSELEARIQVLLRRSRPQQSTSTHLSQFGISLDLLSRRVTRDGTEVELQAKELGLLEYFLRNPDRVLSKTMILENVYGYNFDTQTNIVDVLVCRLRNKIDKEFGKKTIHTIRGLGYVLKED